MLKPNEEVCDKIASAISNILGEEAEMVTRWVVLVETLDKDGDRGLWSLADHDAKPWDTLGMLMFGVQKEQARISRITASDDGGSSE
jgi:hypothetical protein